MIQLITNDIIFTPSHTRHHTKIHLKTCGIYQHIFLTDPFSQLMLQLKMQINSSIEKARSGTPRAILSGSIGCRFYHTRMIG